MTALTDAACGQGGLKVPPSKFGKYAVKVSPAHIDMLERCLYDPTCADNYDDEGNPLLFADTAKRQDTLSHLADAFALTECAGCRHSKPCC